MFKLNIKLLRTLYICLFFGYTQFALAQESTENQLYAISTQNEEVYIYHTVNLGFLNGFFVERRVDGSDWERLTEQPVFPANGGTEFLLAAEEHMPVLREATNRESPQEVFLALMTRQTLARIASSAYPEVASALGRLYIDENPILNDVVEYRFVVVNSMENPTGRVLYGEFNLQPGIPATPTNVNAENRGREVSLKWNYTDLSFTEDGVSRFLILQSDGEQIRPVLEPGIYRTDGRTSYSFTFDVERLNREYRFSVVAVDIAGQYSDPSEEFVIQVIDNVPPRAVTGVRSTLIGESNVEISWNVSIESKVEGYHLYRTVAGSEDFDQITEEPLDILENTFLDQDLEGGRHYRYYITAFDGAGNESEPSNVTSIIVEEYLPPLPVSDLSLERTEDNRVVIQWEHTESEEFNTYVLLRRQIYPQLADSYTRVNQERQRENRFEDRGIGREFPEGVTYRYGVAVAGASGLQSDTTFHDIHIPLVTPPQPPSDISLNRGEGQRINISWGASPTQSVTTYEVQRVLKEEGDRSDTEEMWEYNEELLIGRSGRGNRFLRDSGIEPGFTYLYQVVAVDSAGNRSEPLYSEPLYFRTQSLPQAVRNLQVRHINNQNFLRWEPVSTQRLQSYRIYRAEVATGILVFLHELSTDEREWQDPEGEPGMWYLVRAVDSTGNLSPRTRLTQAVR
jgi:fibronectin type 3 domain-containing protein